MEIRSVKIRNRTLEDSLMAGDKRGEETIYLVEFAGVHQGETTLITESFFFEVDRDNRCEELKGKLK